MAELQKVVLRCPYCVAEGAFRLLVEGPDGIHACDHCGHTVVPDDPERECMCPKCERLRSVSNRFHPPAKRPS